MQLLVAALSNQFYQLLIILIIEHSLVQLSRDTVKNRLITAQDGNRITISSADCRHWIFLSSLTLALVSLLDDVRHDLPLRLVLCRWTERPECPGCVVIIFVQPAELDRIREPIGGTGIILGA